jgi:lysozyme family protein
MDADEEYIRRNRLMICVCVCMGMEVRNIHIHRHTDARTHALIHKDVTDDEDYEILRHPYRLCYYEQFLLSSEVLLEPYADATSVP